MRLRSLASALSRDPLAIAASLFLLLVIAMALFGGMLFSDAAGGLNLRARNAPPFDLARGWLNILGADALGRPILARIAVATANTLGIAVGAVFLSMIVGGAIGILVGLRDGWVSNVIMRSIDVVMSFPSLLL